MYINTNIRSLNSQNRLASAAKSLDTSYQRLSSGLRVNTAKDDASGMQISNRLTTEIEVLTQGNRNANDCISMCQVVEGSLDEVTNMIQRIRTLAIQAANGSNSSDERNDINMEVQQLSEEIVRIGTDTTYGGNLNIFEMYASGTSDYAEKISTYQVGSDGTKTISIEFKRLDELLTASVDGENLTIWGNNVSGYQSVDVLTAEDANKTIECMDSLLSNIDSYRATLGAVQNRVSASISNQENVMENLNEARSRIRDADYAKETANMARLNVMQQAASSILVQANQSAEAALNMLQ